MWPAAWGCIIASTTRPLVYFRPTGGRSRNRTQSCATSAVLRRPEGRGEGVGPGESAKRGRAARQLEAQAAAPGRAAPWPHTPLQGGRQAARQRKALPLAAAQPAARGAHGSGRHSAGTMPTTITRPRRPRLAGRPRRPDDSTAPHAPPLHAGHCE